MDTTERDARNAATGDARNANLACQSQSTAAVPLGSAGTVTSPEERGRLSPPAQAFVASRKISGRTLAALNVASGVAFFRDLDRKTDALFFKYAEGWKARSVTEKAFTAGGGFKTSFWNLERVLNGPLKQIYITEGELDACALVEAGIPAHSVLSVPNGATMRNTDGEAELRGFEYAKDALKAGLNKAEKIIWAGDNDEVGLALRSDMVRVFGAARFHTLEWPEGCKDAGDMLATGPADELLELAQFGSLPWPVDGLFKMSELPEPPKLTIWAPGFPEWEGKIKLAPRTISVVTGHPGHGKTQLWIQIWYNVTRQYGVPIALASFESLPKPYIRRYLRTLYCGELEINCTEEQKAAADKFIEDRFLFMMNKENRPDLGWFLDMAEIAVMRHGAKVVQIDPWNRLESTRPQGQSETDFIGNCLRTIHSFAKDLNCHVQVLAHPAKMDSGRRNEPPVLEDIAGSKNWDNMVDQGFAVHRPKMFEDGEVKTECKLYHRKARFSDLGYPCTLKLNYNLKKGRFESHDYDNRG